MSEMHSRQSEFTYSACGLFTKNKEKTQKFKELGDARYICQSKLDKACFNVILIMENLKIHLEEMVLIKSYVIKDLMWLKIQNVMDAKVDLYQWFINVFIKSNLLHTKEQFLRTTISKRLTQTKY